MKRLSSLPMPWPSAWGGTATMATMSSVGRVWNVGVTALLCSPTQTWQLPDPPAIRA